MLSYVHLERNSSNMQFVDYLLKIVPEMRHLCLTFSVKLTIFCKSCDFLDL